MRQHENQTTAAESSAPRTRSERGEGRGNRPVDPPGQANRPSHTHEPGVQEEPPVNEPENPAGQGLLSHKLTARDVYKYAYKAQNAVLGALGLESAHRLLELGREYRDKAWPPFSKVRQAADSLLPAVTTIDDLQEHFSDGFEEDPGRVQENPAGQGNVPELVRDARRACRELETLVLSLLRHEAGIMHKKEEGWKVVGGLGAAADQVHETIVLLSQALGEKR